MLSIIVFLHETTLSVCYAHILWSCFIVIVNLNIQLRVYGMNYRLKSTECMVLIVILVLYIRDG